MYITCHGSSNGKSVLALNKVFFSSKQIFFLQLSLLSSIYITFSPYKHIPYPSLFPFLFLLSLFFITFLFPFPYDLFSNIHVYMFLLSLWSLFFFLSKPFIPPPPPPGSGFRVTDQNSPRHPISAFICLGCLGAPDKNKLAQGHRFYRLLLKTNISNFYTK